MADYLVVKKVVLKAGKSVATKGGQREQEMVHLMVALTVQMMVFHSGDCWVVMLVGRLAQPKVKLRVLH